MDKAQTAVKIARLNWILESIVDQVGTLTKMQMSERLHDLKAELEQFAWEQSQPRKRRTKAEMKDAEKREPEQKALPEDVPEGSGEESQV